MKTLVLGDIHGRTVWKDIIKKENPDKVIFLGDYVSSHDGITEEDQFNNLLEILDYFEANKDIAVLLRGNHDIEALGYYWAECWPKFYDKWRFTSNNEEVKRRFIDDTHWIYIDGNNLFSHAGVSKHWLEKTGTSLENINNLTMDLKGELFGFAPGKDNPWDSYGASIYQPCTWIRPGQLLEDHIDGYNQFVGHTTMAQVVDEERDGLKFYFCDSLADKSYATIVDGEVTINFL